MNGQTLLETFQRYRTMGTHRISSLPIVILMPHSACNCQCVMCDIWKGNRELRQLKVEDIQELLNTLKKFHTKEVVMSGGEALLNPNFFRFCEILKTAEIKLTLLSTGLTIERHVENLVEWVDEIIVSLDGDEPLHDQIRNIPGAFKKLRSGIEAIRRTDPEFKITGRSVIHKYNFRKWAAIVDTAGGLGLNRISFLPADVSSQAFNRQIPWTSSRQEEIMLDQAEIGELRIVFQHLVENYKAQFDSGFIAETPQRLAHIPDYYAAFYGLNPFPFKKCNAPWVSTVIEADGMVRPCFFHPAIGNIHSESLDEILNSRKAMDFRKYLDVETNAICMRCVCSLYLSPLKNPVQGN